MTRRASVVALLWVAVTQGACLDDLVRSFIQVTPVDAEPGFVDAGAGYDGSITDRLTLTGVKPDHGPFVGGTTVVISGTGFTKDTTVRIGGKDIQVGETRVLSPLSVQVVTPAGEVGPATVEVSTPAGTVRQEGAFTYDPVSLDPDSGPTVGGTLVTILGRGVIFEDGKAPTLGGKPMTEVEVVSTSVLRARTPTGTAGLTDLVFVSQGKERTVKEAFTYYSSTNPRQGGLGGGPIKGSLTVSVLDWLSRQPVGGARVVVQKARELTLLATADKAGMAVFADPRLKGPITVTAAFPEYQSATLVSFDARDATLLLLKIPKPEPGPLTPGPLAGTVRGFVLFGGATGAGSPLWKIVPEPKSGQVKRVYVYTTSPSVDWGPQTPSAEATIDYANDGSSAWPYVIVGQTGPMAVYAVAGLHNPATDEFEPYAMGITRGVVVGPGETQKVDVWVTTPLTEKVTVQVKDVPPQVSKHRLRLAISLGADGVILRKDHEIEGVGPLASVDLGRLPSFQHQGLQDASYTVDLQLQSAAATGLPNARATERSVQPKDGVLLLDQFVGVPQQVKPPAGGLLEGNTLAWRQEGAPASMAVTMLRQTDDTPIWMIVSPGNVTEVKLPDPEAMGLPAWPSGPVIWLQWLVHLPGFDFDTYNYGHLSTDYWDRWSFDELQLKVP